MINNEIPQKKKIDKTPIPSTKPDKEPPTEEEDDFLDDIDKVIKKAEEYQKRDEKEGE